MESPGILPGLFYLCNTLPCSPDNDKRSKDFSISYSSLLSFLCLVTEKDRIKQTRMIKLLLIEDEIFFAEIIKRSLLEQIPDLEIVHCSSAQEGLNTLSTSPDIISIDYNLPDMTGLELMKKIKILNNSIPLIIMSGQEEVEIVVAAYKNGAHDYIIKNDNAGVYLANSLKNIISTLYFKKEYEKLQEQIIDRNKYLSIIGNSPSILQTLKLIQKVENTNMTVLITGESGTGKELVAGALHYNSSRKKRPFVTVNMAAIPEDLIESELFGHEKGAFTDARERRIGKFEEANEGSIFLDEIGEMQLDLQSRLLRILETKEVTRLGSNKAIRLDIRIIAATNKDLSAEVKAGRFRQDLFYRLQGFLIQLPSLNKRGDDVLLLAKHFLKEFCSTNRMESLLFTKDALKMLLEYSWPGNVRELKSTIERAALLADRKEITVEDIMFHPAVLAI
jgi:two-component system response regulator AtoC